MNLTKKTPKGSIFSLDFLILCKSCNQILFHSKEIEKLYMLLSQLVLVVLTAENNQNVVISEEIKIKNEASMAKNPDFQCVYKDVLCKQCKTGVGIFYVATKENMDVLIEKPVFFEEQLKFYSISDCKYENFREFSFANGLIDDNLDHLHLLSQTDKNPKKQNNNKNQENNPQKYEEFPELATLVEDVKKAFSAMNEGMKVFENRLSQSEQTVGTLLALVDKINKRVHSHFY